MNCDYSKSTLKSPIGKGQFDIYINKTGNLLYKKIRDPNSIKNIQLYKKIINNLYNSDTINKYILDPNKIIVDNDGSYTSTYINNGIRLYDINEESKINLEILNKLTKGIDKLKLSLNSYSKTNKLYGDWALHNLIYCKDRNKIYNIDLEGFYTYPYVHDNGNCDISYCNTRFDKLIQIINNLKQKYQYFTLILWNPIYHIHTEVIKNIPNILERKDIIIPDETLHDFIFDVYKLDTRCSHSKVLPPKIEKLKNYENKHIIIKFEIKNPTYSNGICNQAVKLKENIRNKYIPHVTGYIKDIIIHVADNYEQSKYIWEKQIQATNTIKLFIQKAETPLRYKLTDSDKDGTDGWNTVGTIDAYTKKIENTSQIFIYRASNPRRYCISDTIIFDSNWEYHSDYYCNKADIDKRLEYYKSNQLVNHNQNIGDEKYTNVLKLKCIFDKLENYVVLRGYNNLHNEIPLLKNSDDIDLLLPDKDSIVKLYGNNTILIDGDYVKFDRRYIGDNYYDINWQNDMLYTKTRKHFFYILDEFNNYYATLYHCLIHKGVVHKKYEKMFLEHENLHNLNSDILSRYYQLLKYMLKKKYNFVRAIDKGVGFFKAKYKINLFIIRKRGMKKEIIENILNLINNEYNILDKIIININNKKKLYSKFYDNYDKHKEDIERANDNQCLAIITNNPINKNPNNLKDKIRKQYISYYPPLGNIIHSSDSPEDCEKELALLFNESISDFKNIGTYYSQLNI